MNKQQSLNRRIWKVYYTMNKKGFVDGFSLVMFILVVISIGGVTYILAQPAKQTDVSNFYVGDITSKHFYSSNCIETISEKNRVFIPSPEIAQQINFTYRECKK